MFVPHHFSCFVLLRTVARDASASLIAYCTVRTAIVAQRCDVLQCEQVHVAASALLSDDKR